MSTQIAVKLPEALVNRIDELVAQGSFPSRSSAVRHALEIVVATEGRRLVDRAYEDGYSRTPQTREEMDEATRLADQAIHDEPWERWW